MPDFFIAGTMKSGTSSLFAYLCAHPSIRWPFRKETHFFGAGKRTGKSAAWYAAHFPLRVTMQPSDITGEATPGYGFEPGIETAIHRMVPGARIIFLLRNPVERAISHYFHEVRMGRETLPIGEAMAREEERLAAARAAGPRGTETLLHAAYQTRGRYHEEVRRYFETFGREQVLVLGSGDLFGRPRETVARAVSHLGLPPMPEGQDYPVRNRGTNREDVPADVRRDLEVTFRAPNEALWELLGHQLAW